MSIKRKIELLLQEIRQATHYSKQNHVDKAWTLIGQLQEPVTLNPMSEPPEDSRTVLIKAQCGSWSSGGHMPLSKLWLFDFDFETEEKTAIGWIEAPTVEIEDEQQ